MYRPGGQFAGPSLVAALVKGAGMGSSWGVLRHWF